MPSRKNFVRWARETEAGQDLEADLTGYATEEYVDDAVSEIDLTPFATEEYVDDAVSAIPVHGQWTSYTPTWGVIGGTSTLGNGILTARYKLLDSKTGLLHISLQWGSTTSCDVAGGWSFSLPSGWTSGPTYQILAAHIADAGTDHKVAVAKISPNDTIIAEIIPEAGNTVTRASPMTWANNDLLNISGMLQLA